MKQMSKVILGMVIMASAVGAYAKDVTKLSNGELIIDELKVSVKTTSGKVVKVPVSEDNMSVSVDKKLVTGDSEVILLSQTTGGNACPATYTFVKVDKAGTVSYTPSFGTCSDLIKVSQQGNTITATMPNMNGKGISKYVYNGTTLTENGKPVK